MQRIPFYDTSMSPWTEIGFMSVQDVWDAPSVEMTEDETKLKVFSVRLRWGSKM
jgi:hypothetical protein